MTLQELQHKGRELQEAESKVYEIKAEIITALGMQSLIGHGSLVKVDWQKIKRGISPMPWVEEQVNEMLKQGEKY